MDFAPPPLSADEGDPPDRRAQKEAILKDLVTLLESSGKIANPIKLFRDLRNRERKATTGIGFGIAIPHVRTRQAREFVMALARCPAGVDFDSVDGRKVHLFFAMVSPPYDDRTYLRVYQRIGRLFSQEGVLQRILDAGTGHEIIRILTDAS